MIDKIKNLDVLLLEANHDVHMLQVGSYPYPLKQRILGKKGHLSNELSGQLLGEVLHDHFNTVILGHLSKENNYAELAYETVRLEVKIHIKAMISQCMWQSGTRRRRESFFSL
jgi:phosphoribosyl 1,2-cyclic phosphodiesterase